MTRPLFDLMSEKRKMEKQKAKPTQENQMACDVFYWHGTLQKQRLPVLNKYIDRFNLVDSRNINKTQKLDANIIHLHATVNKNHFQFATAEEKYPKRITNVKLGRSGGRRTREAGEFDV